MEQDCIPAFNRLDFWYAQMYSWIKANPSSRSEVVQTIIRNCSKELDNIEAVVKGRFEDKPEPITDETAYIKFCNLSFNIEIDNKEIECIARIRINPCIKLPAFSLDKNFEDDLTNCVVSTELKQAFQHQEISLSENAKISKISDGNSCRIWMINDDENEYTIRKENSTLGVYNKQKAPFNSKIWVIISSISEFKDKMCEAFFEKIKEDFY